MGLSDLRFSTFCSTTARKYWTASVERLERSRKMEREKIARRVDSGFGVLVLVNGETSL
jgi:ribosomal protein L44E